MSAATMTDVSRDETEAGNYFVANYPPFSFWKPEHLPTIEAAFAAPADTHTPLGLYLHIPFCRKRCKFCYFKVYTDVNAAAIQDYVDHLTREVALLADRPAICGRPFQFVYFGGGTPSYLSAKQLDGMVVKLRQHIGWDQAEEVTFECEPGTLSEAKVNTLHDIGVTRLSLGVENFSDSVLEENGRAHLSGEIHRSWEWIQNAGFAQVNIDLIAGMVGETWENWRDCVRKTIALSPDSVTIYQMELPFNTRYVRELQIVGQGAVANWSVKRDWLRFAFDEMRAAGYRVSSAYTLIKDRPGQHASFKYRDHLWRGADLLCAGVASFGHLAGVHYQNIDTLEKYAELLDAGVLPLGRALPTTPRDRLIREWVLQLKLGRVSLEYFRRKYHVEPTEQFRQPLARLQERGLLAIDDDAVTLSENGLLRVDSLLPDFFAPEHQSARYT